MARIRRALLSVSNKEGLVDLARGLARHGVAMISSGGTAAVLREHGIEVMPVSEYTRAPEILDGRVKTLHPRIFGGILARPTEEHRAQLREHEMDEIDLVVVNLYPFEQTVARADVTVAAAIEQIDIGGPSLVRAAAKNHERVAIVVDPADYAGVLAELDASEGKIGDGLRRELAGRAFAHTAAYDAAIARYFQQNVSVEEDSFKGFMPLFLKKIQGLRYGENPHQSGAFYGADGVAGGAAFEQLSGKALSYNNLLDVDGAWGLARDLPEAAVAIIKHGNPCGAAVGDRGDLAEIFRRAKSCDPVSAFGGIVACNVPVDEALAVEIKEMFLEVVVAPAFDGGALAALKKKKNLRLLRRRSSAWPTLQLRSAAGGILVQGVDDGVEDLAVAKVVSKRAPTPAELADLDLAWRVCKHVKSNAIVFAGGALLLGVGAGQMSRVDAVKLAQTKATRSLAGSVLASDAFFPFRDGIDEAAGAGAKAVVQPGGSVRDDEVIAAADEHGIAMVFTGVRHFRH